MTESGAEKKEYGNSPGITGEAAEKLRHIGVRILSAARDELYFSMRFMDVALSSLAYQMDASVSPFGTDGAILYFHPRQLGGLLRENRILVNRGYLHMVLHCIFRHMFKEGTEERYWNLSCDIAVEHIIDGCDLRPVRFSRSLLRRETYRKLEQSGHVLNAERICRELKACGLEEKELKALEEEFRTDDHRYWERQGKDGKRSEPAAGMRLCRKHRHRRVQHLPQWLPLLLCQFQSGNCGSQLHKMLPFLSPAAGTTGPGGQGGFP